MSKLSFRSNLIIFLISAVVFIGTNLAGLYLTKEEIIESCNQKAERDLDFLLKSVDSELTRTQQATETFASLVFENGQVVLPEEIIYKRMETFLKHNPYVTGIEAGFIDDLYPQYAEEGKYGFIPLVRNQKDKGLVRYQMGEVRDVRNVNDWYSYAAQNDVKIWSLPWYSEENELITTYSVPLHNQNGAVIGVLAVDLPLQSLEEVTRMTRPTPDATVSVMLSTDLTYIIHPNQSYVLKESFTSASKKLNIPISDEMVENIKSRTRGKDIVSWGKHSSYWYYAPIEKARCVAMIDMPLNTVYAPVWDVFYAMMICSGIGLILLIIFLWLRNTISRS